jgi:hypothetical protein
MDDFYRTHLSGMIAGLEKVSDFPPRIILAKKDEGKYIVLFIQPSDDSVLDGIAGISVETEVTNGLYKGTQIRATDEAYMKLLQRQKDILEKHGKCFLHTLPIRILTLYSTFS